MRALPGLCGDYCSDYWRQCRYTLSLLLEDVGNSQQFANLTATIEEDHRRFCEFLVLKDKEYCYPSVLTNAGMSYMLYEEVKKKKNLGVTSPEKGLEYTALIALKLLLNTSICELNVSVSIKMMLHISKPASMLKVKCLKSLVRMLMMDANSLNCMHEFENIRVCTVSPRKSLQ